MAGVSNAPDAGILPVFGIASIRDLFYIDLPRGRSNYL